jgi:hypothetical protein
MQLHKHTYASHGMDSTQMSWRSRLLVAGVMSTALAIYLAGIVWFGQGLAEDVRAGVREVPAGVLIPDLER